MERAQDLVRRLGLPQQSSEEDAAAFARLVAEGRLGPGIAVTARGKVDGAGAQAMAVVSAMVMARYAGCRYLHSPLSSVEHAEGSREDWARRWESFLNFGDGEESVPDDAELVSLADVVRSPESYAGRPVVVVARVFGLPLETVAIRDALRHELRARYWRSPKSSVRSHRAPAGGITVAVHVRRGDVTPERHASRFITDERVLRQIARLRAVLAPLGRPVTVNLYSQGAAEQFRAFAEAGCGLHLSEDAFETFHNLVTADILLGAPSTFSYLAGHLSEGIVLDHRRRFPRLESWLGRRKNGDVPMKRLRRALRRRIGWRERLAYRVRHWRRALRNKRLLRGRAVAGEGTPRHGV